jgi:predicted DNA-binding protein (UPF0251 family)
MVNSTLRQDEKQALILSLLHQGIRQAEIARNVGLSRSALSQRLLNYSRHKLLTQKEGQFLLTNEGLNKISRRVSKPLQIVGPTMTMRKHNIRVVVPLREPLKERPQVFLGNKGIQFKAMGLKNVFAGSFDLEGFVIELMPKSAVVILPDVELPEATALEELAARTWENLGFILDKAQATLGIRFRRPGRELFISKIVSREIAFTNHPLAAAVKSLITGVWVIKYDEEDNKPRIIVDFSWRVPEAEAVHTTHAPMDAGAIKEKLNPEINRMLTGEAEAWRKGLACVVCKLERKERGRAFTQQVIRNARETYINEQRRLNNGAD